jgi:hypothetical protein
VKVKLSNQNKTGLTSGKSNAGVPGEGHKPAMMAESVMLAMDERALPRTADTTARSHETVRLLQKVFHDYPAYTPGSNLPTFSGSDLKCRDCDALFSST